MQHRNMPQHQNGLDFYRAHANPAAYRFRAQKNWVYADKRERVLNKLARLTRRTPHLVLYDGSGVPRFALNYVIYKNNIVVIHSIQRERTQYKQTYGTKTPHLDFFEWTWDEQAETRESKQLQRQLGGTHPAEFLLAEFIRRLRPAIKRGMKVCIVSPNLAPNALLYKPLIDRFFKKQKEPVQIEPIQTNASPNTVSNASRAMTVHALSTTKQRVKQILGT